MDYPFSDVTRMKHNAQMRDNRAIYHRGRIRNNWTRPYRRRGVRSRYPQRSYNQRPLNFGYNSYDHSSFCQPIKIQKPPSPPLPGSEEYRQRNIEQTSAFIKQQLNIENCGSSMETFQTNTLPQLATSEPSTSLNVETEELTVSSKSNQKTKTKLKKQITPTSINVKEIHEKILKHIANLSYQKKMEFVNRPFTAYDPAIELIQKQKKLEISKKLREMSKGNLSVSDNQEIYSIIPDLDIKIEDLPAEVMQELSTILNDDINDSSAIDGITENYNINDYNYSYGSTTFEPFQYHDENNLNSKMDQVNAEFEELSEWDNLPKPCSNMRKKIKLRRSDKNEEFNDSIILNEFNSAPNQDTSDLYQKTDTLESTNLFDKAESQICKDKFCANTHLHDMANSPILTRKHNKDYGKKSSRKSVNSLPPANFFDDDLDYEPSDNEIQDSSVTTNNTCMIHQNNLESSDMNQTNSAETDENWQKVIVEKLEQYENTFLQKSNLQNTPEITVENIKETNMKCKSGRAKLNKCSQNVKNIQENENIKEKMFETTDSYNDQEVKGISTINNMVETCSTAYTCLSNITLPHQNFNNIVRITDEICNSAFAESTNTMVHNEILKKIPNTSEMDISNTSTPNQESTNLRETRKSTKYQRQQKAEDIHNKNNNNIPFTKEDFTKESKEVSNVKSKKHEVKSTSTITRRINLRNESKNKTSDTKDERDLEVKDKDSNEHHQLKDNKKIPKDAITLNNDAKVNKITKDNEKKREHKDEISSKTNFDHNKETKEKDAEKECKNENTSKDNSDIKLTSKDAVLSEESQLDNTKKDIKIANKQNIKSSSSSNQTVTENENNMKHNHKLSETVEHTNVTKLNDVNELRYDKKNDKRSRIVSGKKKRELFEPKEDDLFTPICIIRKSSNTVQNLNQKINKEHKNENKECNHHIAASNKAIAKQNKLITTESTEQTKNDTSNKETNNIHKEITASNVSENSLSQNQQKQLELCDTNIPFKNNEKHDSEASQKKNYRDSSCENENDLDAESQNKINLQTNKNAKSVDNRDTETTKSINTKAKIKLIKISELLSVPPKRNEDVNAHDVEKEKTLKSLPNTESEKKKKSIKKKRKRNSTINDQQDNLHRTSDSNDLNNEFVSNKKKKKSYLEVSVSDSESNNNFFSNETFNEESTVKNKIPVMSNSDEEQNADELDLPKSNESSVGTNLRSDNHACKDSEVEAVAINKSFLSNSINFKVPNTHYEMIKQIQYIEKDIQQLNNFKAILLEHLCLDLRPKCPGREKNETQNTCTKISKTSKKSNKQLKKKINKGEENSVNNVNKLTTDQQTFVVKENENYIAGTRTELKGPQQMPLSKNKTNYNGKQLSSLIRNCVVKLVRFDLTNT